MKQEVYDRVSRAMRKLTLPQEKLCSQWGRRLLEDAWGRAPTFDVEGTPVYSLKIRDASWVQAALYALENRPITDEEESELMDIKQALHDLEAQAREL
jgi:hypothetical protein